MTYEGWSNRATWLVALWINNDEGLYEIVKTHLCDRPFYEYAPWLETWVNEFVDQDVDRCNLLVRDLVTQALSDVNWKEIADTWKETFIS